MSRTPKQEFSATAEDYSLIKISWQGTGRGARWTLGALLAVIVAALIARWVTLPAGSRYLFPKSADDWSAWGTWIGSLGAAAALFYAAISFREDWKARDKNQQELLNDVHSMAKSKASNLKFVLLDSRPRDLQYKDEALKAELAEMADYERTRDNHESELEPEHPPRDRYVMYALITNASENDVFEDVSLFLADPQDSVSIVTKSYRSPLPSNGHYGSIPGASPQWIQSSITIKDTQHNGAKYLGKLAPQTQVLLQIELKYKKESPLEMRWSSTAKAAFQISPEGEMLCRYRDGAGRYWHRSNQSMSDELFRTWMPGDEPTSRQRRASEDN